MKMTRIVGIVFMSLAAINLAQTNQAHAATVPTNITGTWTGKVKALSFHYVDPNSNPSPSSLKPTHSTASVSITFKQASSVLIAQAVFTTSSGTVLSGDLDGVIGNNTFVLVGITSNANESDKTLLTGHITAQGIAGTGIVYSAGNSDNEIAYSLKPSAAHSLTTGEIFTSHVADPEIRDASIVNVSGTASGKQYSISSVARVAPFKSPLTGSFTSTNQVSIGQLTINSETFAVTGPQFAGAALVAGSNAAGTRFLIVSAHTNNKGATGIGYLFSNDTLDEFKINLKKQ